MVSNPIHTTGFQIFLYKYKIYRGQHKKYITPPELCRHCNYPAITHHAIADRNKLF
jgi:hypothetical protein